VAAKGPNKGNFMAIVDLLRATLGRRRTDQESMLPDKQIQIPATNLPFSYPTTVLIQFLILLNTRDLEQRNLETISTDTNGNVEGRGKYEIEQSAERSYRGRSERCES